MWVRVEIDVKLSMKKERVKFMSCDLEGENNMQMVAISRQGSSKPRVGEYSFVERKLRMLNLIL